MFVGWTFNSQVLWRREDVDAFSIAMEMEPDQVQSPEEHHLGGLVPNKFVFCRKYFLDECKWISIWEYRVSGLVLPAQRCCSSSLKPPALLFISEHRKSSYSGKQKLNKLLEQNASSLQRKELLWDQDDR